MGIKYNGKNLAGLYYGDKEIVKRIINDSIVYQKNARPNAFRFKNVSDQPNTVKLVKSGDAPTITLEKSSNGLNYTLCDIYAGITLQPNEIVYLKGDNTTSYNSYYNYNSFTFTGNIECHGSIMDLYDGGTDTVICISNYQFGNLFKNCTSLTTAPKLPATTLTIYCYNGMFKGCTSLTTAPELPATTLAKNCYSSMFKGCTSLTTAPELPATILANSCYSSMFSGCTSLTTAPELPATTLADYCYQSMFWGCTSLVSAPELPATTLASYCYSSMFNRCKSLTQATELPAINLANDCYQGMFIGCSSLTTAPKVLPATTLANNCYNGMFNNCKSLQTVPKLPATTLADYCYQNMFKDCESLVNAPELPATQLAYSCYSSMFDGCTSLTQAPQLPATTLASYCYGWMFDSCSKINYVKVGATSWDTYGTRSWLNNVAPTGTVEMPAELVTWDGTGTQPEGSIPLNSTSGVPTGWTVKKPVVEDHRFRFYNPGDQVNELKLNPMPLGGQASQPNKVIVQISSDGNVWSSPHPLNTITLKPKETVFIKGENKTIQNMYDNSSPMFWCYTFSSTQPIECHGNIMDLVKDKNTCMYAYEFYSLFKDMTTLLTAPELPASIISDYCYSNMFYGCTSLKVAPALPANYLYYHCYDNMFAFCTSLITPPALPAENLSDFAYSQMFFGCTSLTTPPALPAKKAHNAYFYTFARTSIEEPPVLNATGGVNYKGMFEGCKNLKHAPILPDLYPSGNGYNHIFTDCPNIDRVEIHSLDWNSIIYTDWLKGAAPNGVIVAADSAKIDLNVIPSGWTVEQTIHIDIPEEKHELFRFYNPTDKINTLTLIPKYDSPIFSLSTDGINWTEPTKFKTYDIQPHQSLYIKGKNDTMKNNRFSSTQPIECYGELAWICNNGYFQFEGSYFDYSGLFYQMTTLRRAPDNVEGIGISMFAGCTGLTETPKIMHIGESNNYGGGRFMFDGCTNLKTAYIDSKGDKLIDLKNFEYCFRNCINLKKIYMNNILSNQPSAGLSAINWLEGAATTGEIIAPDVRFYDKQYSNYGIISNSVSGVPSGWTLNGEYSRF